MNILLLLLSLLQVSDPNLRITMLANKFADVPYANAHARQFFSTRYQLDCQTFVETALALLNAHDVEEYENAHLHIRYGALNKYFAKLPLDNFYNRNHFVDADFNRINQKQKRLRDITKKIAPHIVQYARATITRNKWFAKNGPKITTVNHPPRIKTQRVKIAYLPKEALVQFADEHYQVNQSLLDKIETPAVIEMIMDVHKWFLHGTLISARIGSETSVSHMGLLYRQTFARQELIYHQIQCGIFNGRQACKTTPIYCAQEMCQTLMLAHATNAYPNNYFWQKNRAGHYQCERTVNTRLPFTMCNRVERIPLAAYLVDQQYDMYRFMDNPAVLGIHIEKII